MEEKKTTPNNADQNTDAEAQEAPKATKGSSLFSMGSLSSMLSEKEQKSLLFYIAVGIILVEFAVTVGALITGIAGAEQLGGGKVQFNFPWTGYLVTVVVAPIIVILLVNLIGMGFYRAVHGEPAMSAEQFDQMPEKARNLFSLVRGAPTIILFGGVILLGAVLYYLDGVMSLLLKLGDSVETIVIWGTCGLVLAWCLSYCARMWLMYRTRRLEEDYAFRREVLERTGMVILDGKNMLGSQEGTQYIVERALPSGGEQGGPVMDALPVADVTKPEAEAVASEANVVTPHADNEILDAEIIEPVKPVVEPVVETVEPVVEVVESVVEPIAPETAPEPPVVETIAEAEPVVETLVEPTVEPELEVPTEAEVLAEDVPAETTEPVAEVEAMAEPEAVVEEVVAETVVADVEVAAEPATEADFAPSSVDIVHVAVGALFDSKEAVPAVEELIPVAEEIIPVAEEPAACTPVDVVEAEPEPESVQEPSPSSEAAPTPEPSPTPEVTPAVSKASAPQSPQAPQAPQHAQPKPPVRRARLSDKQKRRS